MCVRTGHFDENYLDLPILASLAAWHVDSARQSRAPNKWQKKHQTSTRLATVDHLGLRRTRYALELAKYLETWDK